MSFPNKLFTLKSFSQGLFQIHLLSYTFLISLLKYSSSNLYVNFVLTENFIIAVRKTITYHFIFYELNDLFPSDEELM